MFQSLNVLGPPSLTNLTFPKFLILKVEHPIVQRDVKHFNMENRLETVYVLFNFGVADIMVQEFFARRMVSKTGTSVRS